MHPAGAQSTQSRHAFTLIEVMMATVVLLVAVVGLFEAVTIGAGMLNVSRKQTIALQIIRSEIEAVHLTAWPAGAADGTTPPTAVTSFSFPELTSLQNVSQGFTLSRIVVTVRPGPNWLKKITFIVTWTESTGRSYTRTGYTYCANNGLNALYQR